MNMTVLIRTNEMLVHPKDMNKLNGSRQHQGYKKAQCRNQFNHLFSSAHLRDDPEVAKVDKKSEYPLDSVMNG
jgi:hypothetical protein